MYDIPLPVLRNCSFDLFVILNIILIIITVIAVFGNLNCLSVSKPAVLRFVL